MTILRRAALAALALALALPAAGQPRLPNPLKALTGASDRPLKLAPGQWPQARSDVAADPAIRFGALPNGMRYAIVKNATPPGQASLRLRFDAGSLMESDQQKGLAHFLEHMAFNGSKAVPEGEMVKILERLGLAFGADTNASTSYDETVYKLDLPRTDEETVDTSLMLMREAAGNLTIAQDAVDRERGVVLSEERARDTPSYKVFKEQLAFWLKGQRPPLREPIGDVEVLKTAPASQIADYYRKYYRPERAVLVAVGDFDPAVIEAKIKARFADWQAAAPDGGDPDLGPVAKRGQETKLVVDPGAPTNIMITWISPPDLAPDTLAKRKRDIVELLGFAVLNRRLQRLGRAENPPFLGAGGFQTDLLDAAEVTTISISSARDKWAEALAAGEREQRRFVTFGVRQDELDREIEEVRADLKSQVAGAATRRTPSLASEIVGSLADNDVVTSPAQDLALFEEVVKGLKAEEVSQAIKADFTGGGPLLFMSSPVAIEGGEATLAAALETSRKVAVTPPAAGQALEWPYASFGAPGKVAEQRDVTDLETQFVRFENGVRLTIKPTKFRADQVLIAVNFGRGLLDWPADKQSVNWAASSALIEGGLKKMAREDMEQALAAKVWGSGFGVGEESFQLNGRTRPEDLEVELQVLAAYMAEPGWRPEAFQRRKASVATFYDQLEATDGGVLSRDLEALLHPGDRRFTFPTREESAKTTLADVQARLAGPLASGPIEVVIVGDVNAEKAIDAVARTFAALPARPAAPPVTDAQRQMGFPVGTATPVALTHKGRADQAVGLVAWKTDDYFSDMQKARVASLLAEVLQLRLIDELREAQGATYSPSAGSRTSRVFDDWGMISASVELPPEKLDDFFRDVAKIVADLRANDVTADELARAKKPRLEEIARQRETNEYWLAQLGGGQEDPRRLDAIRQSLAGYERITAADLKAAAQTYLKDEAAWKLVVKPEKK